MTGNETEQGRPGLRINPMIGILAVLGVGIAVMMFTDEEKSEPLVETLVSEALVSDDWQESVDDAPELRRRIFDALDENVTEIPEIRGWILNALDDLDLAVLADAGRWANKVRDVENYGPEYQMQDLSDRDFSGELLAGASFKYVSLKRANFQGANLEDAFFGLTDSVHANFRGACLLNARFTLSELGNADFTNAYLVGTEFEMTGQVNVDFTDAVREGEKKCPAEVPKDGVID